MSDSLIYICADKSIIALLSWIILDNFCLFIDNSPLGVVSIDVLPIHIVFGEAKTSSTYKALHGYALLPKSCLDASEGIRL
jgi:hypothetical protein